MKFLHLNSIVFILCSFMILSGNTIPTYGVPQYSYNYFALEDTEDMLESFFSLWGSGYARFAQCAYSCDGKHKTPLSTVLFGKSCFKLREAFANSIVIYPSNPWINVSTLCPVIDFSEQGIQLNAEYARDVIFRSHALRLGARALLPIKSISLNRQYTTNDVMAESNNIDTVRSLSKEKITGPAGESMVSSYAYRLDFLSSLMENDQGDLLIKYYQTPLRTGDDDVTDTNDSPINVIRMANSNLPSTPFAATDTEIASVPYLAANGDGASNEGRGKFYHATSYVPLSTNVNLQSQLWVVPTVSWDGVAYQIPTAADNLHKSVEEIINYKIDNSIVVYFNSTNLNFSSQTMSGLGDLDTQLFAQFTWPDSMVWNELNCSFIFPTGKKQLNPLCLLAYPLGNNGHVEIGPGFDAGWYMLSWFSWHARAAYYFVLRAYEPVAAPFEGACVKNIGPCIPATISWRYANIILDINLLEPHSRQFGCNLAYNFYYKSCDAITLHSTSAVDFEETSQTLDACVLSRYTREIAHKIQGEIFWSASLGAIYGGFYYTVAGKNTPIESNVYIGLSVEF